MPGMPGTVGETGMPVMPGVTGMPVMTVISEMRAMPAMAVEPEFFWISWNSRNACDVRNAWSDR